MSKVILYDLPSKPPSACWSLNPWKPRMALNIKGVDYETCWVEYPDLKSKLSSLGFKANESGKWTSPAIQFPDGTKIIDSWLIAPELEKRYPEPSLYVDEPIVAKVRTQMDKIFGPLRKDVVPKVPELLNEQSSEYFQRTRHEAYGKPLSQVLQEDGGDRVWKEVEGPLKEVAEWLKEKEGPFFLGHNISFADIIFVGFLNFLKRVDEHDAFKKAMAFDRSFVELYEASKKWLEKDN